MDRHKLLKGAALFAVIAIIISTSGCAKAPQSTGGGTRLVVTMRYNAPIRDAYHYYFLIRNMGDDIGRNGPIPVIEPPYGGNGFASGKYPSSGTPAFTDFVEYNRTDQPLITDTGYTLYHVPGGSSANPALNVFQPRGNPVFAISPNGSNVLQFELDLAQIVPSPGDTGPSPDNRPRWLQVNIISTSTRPANSATVDTLFMTDALGDQRLGPLSDSFNTFITVDTTQIGKTYESRTFPGPDEPTGDTYPSDRDPAADLVSWSIQVVSR